MTAVYQPRLQAAEAVLAVYQRRQSLSIVRKGSAQQQALSQALAYGSLRYFFQLDFIIKQLVNKPLAKKQQIIHALLLVSLYQLIYSDAPDHAVIHQTVEIVKSLPQSWAQGLVNGVLRQFQRQRSQLLQACQQHNVAAYAHPSWLIAAMQQSWPADWQNILSINNQQAPMVLRVNQQKINRQHYLEKLAQHGMVAQPSPISDCGVVLDQACLVSRLPGFDQGEVSVQDAGAQLAAKLLAINNQYDILDACCAPGGKTGHLLELAPQAKVLAVDYQAQRLQQVKQNLQRLQLSAQLLCDDLSQEGALHQQFTDQQFDRILLDAPCSATGVIRRHPDIKLLRQASDIAAYAKTQRQILDRLWQYLKPGGQLLYVTCSLLPQEGEQVMQYFLAKHADAQSMSIALLVGIVGQYGIQLLPNDQHDGFYYSLVEKRL